MTYTPQSCNLIDNVNKNVNTIEMTTYENDDNESSVCLDKLWLYHQDVYESNDHHTINVFQTKLFSKKLQRLEMVINQQLKRNEKIPPGKKNAMIC